MYIGHSRQLVCPIFFVSRFDNSLRAKKISRKSVGIFAGEAENNT